nr:hypothetical protein CFP56_54690 [Quercus suber]
MPVERNAMQETNGLPPIYPTIMPNDFEAGPSHINFDVNDGVERTEEVENINDQNHGDGYREQVGSPTNLNEDVVHPNSTSSCVSLIPPNHEATPSCRLAHIRNLARNMPVERNAMQETNGLPPIYPTIMPNDFEAGPSHINFDVNDGVERTEEVENINEQNHGDGYREQGRMPNSNVRIESTMLNNGVHAVPIAYWENWKDDHSILNMEAIDNKGFTIRADKKELWKEMKRVLESQELEMYVTLFSKIGK